MRKPLTPFRNYVLSVVVPVLGVTAISLAALSLQPVEPATIAAPQPPQCLGLVNEQFLPCHLIEPRHYPQEWLALSIEV